MQIRIIPSSPDVDLLGLLTAPLDHLEKRHQRLALIVGEVQRRRVRDPTVDTSST
jgi:hypothetical protein